MEGSASAPTHPQIELEPAEWQSRATWASARLLCGAAAFFLVSFVFAYFYLRSQDPNRGWKIGSVNPPTALGVVIVLVLIASAVALRVAAARAELTVAAGGAALVLALISVALQAIAWATLGFGPANGGYASVYFGWTIFYSVLTLACAYWIETQVATAWRRRRGIGATPADVMADSVLVAAGVEACSFFWSFMVLNGVVLFVLLYLL